MGNIARKYFSVVSEPAPALVNNSTLSASVTAPGTAIQINGAASGGTGGYEFSYYYRLASKSTWTSLKAYSTSAAVSFKPTAAGSYVIRVFAKDSAGTKKSIDLNLEAPALTNTSSLSADSIALGDSVQVNAAASGGAGSYEFAVYYRLTSKSTWTTVQAYSANAAVSIKPAAAGSYIVRVFAKDGSGTKKSLDMNLTVTTITNTSGYSGDSDDYIIRLGKSVTINASSTGGRGTTKYALYQKLETAKSWTAVSAYAENTVLTFTPGAVGKYDILINAKDESGKLSQKKLKLEVIN